MNWKRDEATKQNVCEYQDMEKGIPFDCNELLFTNECTYIEERRSSRVFS